MGSSPAAPRVPSQVSRGGLFVSSEVTFSHKAGTLYRHVWSMLTRVIDWKGAGEAPMVTRPAIAYRAMIIMAIIIIEIIVNFMNHSDHVEVYLHASAELVG